MPLLGSFALYLAVVMSLVPVPAVAQEGQALTTQAPPAQEGQTPSVQEGQVSSAQAPSPEETEQERRDQFPSLNIYLPEGEFDIRLRKLIRNVLFEGQVNYNFVDGDVSTFLRYKYYARNFTYKLGLFDTLEFTDPTEARLDFDRVRGGLLLVEVPVDYNKRYFGTLQVDNLSFGNTERPDNNQANAYVKFGYQFGTPFDARLNAIVGESRGRVAPVLTAYREIGPQRAGVGVALTHSFDGLGGDYSYTKFEGEGLRRFDFGNVSFLITRLHLGSFLAKEDVPESRDRPLFEQFTVPRYEFFKLGGRDAMKAIDDTAARGSDEIHFINEFFYPIFRNRDYRFLGATFTNMFAIGYSGAGTAGFDFNDLFEFGDYALDAGLGFETSFFVRDYEVFLNAIYAQTLIAPAEWEGHEIRVSVRTTR